MQKHTAILGVEWLRAVVAESKVTVPPHIESLVEVLKPMVDVALADFHSKSPFLYKADGSPAGKADEAIELLLKDRLLTQYPSHYFKGEETPSVEAEIYQQNDCRWIVDPIDGTRNNEYGRDDFCIAVALQKFNQGHWKVIDSLLVMPVRGEILWASENQGAYALNYNPLISSAPTIVPIHVRAEDKPLNKALVDLSIKPLLAEQEGQLIEALRNVGITHRNIGSAAMAVANVGGKSDGAIVLAHDYDVAAGNLIACEAGAVMSEVDFYTEKAPLTFVIAGRNKTMHDALTSACDLLTIG